MKVKICYTIEVSDDIRKAINLHYGKEGLATREDVQSWYRMHGDSLDEDILYDLEHQNHQDDE